MDQPPSHTNATPLYSPMSLPADVEAVTEAAANYTIKYEELKPLRNQQSDQE